MSPTQFSEAIGIQRAAMSHITIGRNNPSADVITKIIERFEDVDPRWLLTGKGAMKISSNHTDNSPVMDKMPINAIQSVNIASSDDVSDESPDLFENCQRKTVGKNVYDCKMIEKKNAKTIDKIHIFYSNHTYETFIPEKYQ